MQSLGILRRLACGASLVLAALAAGCMSIADPVTLAERKSAQPIPMKDVLVVLDYRLDIAHRQAPGAALSPAYEMHYVSDGVVCFGLSQYANKEDCRNKLREQVNRQLQQYRTGS